MTNTGIDGEFTKSQIYWADFYVLNNCAPIYSTRPPKHKPQWSPINAGRLAAAKIKEIVPNIISSTSVASSKIISAKTSTNEYFIRLRKFEAGTDTEKTVSPFRFQQFVQGYNEISMKIQGFHIF